MPVSFIADLHIHTCLSPCAELTMAPRNIVEKAASLGINMIAICDHNSAENVGVTENLARDKGIRVVPGIEITSSEEVHILGLYPHLDNALSMQEVIYAHLQPGTNDPDRFGMQVIVNEDNEVLGFNERLLIGSTDLPVDEIVKLIHGCGGLAIASHIDREGFGILGQLGFIPPDIGFDALEISARVGLAEAQEKFAEYGHIPWISSSDSHCLEDIGKRTSHFFMNHATFEEMSLALLRQDERSVFF